jgi:hypothetical protein
MEGVRFIGEEMRAGFLEKAGQAGIVDLHAICNAQICRCSDASLQLRGGSAHTIGAKGLAEFTRHSPARVKRANPE